MRKWVWQNGEDKRFVTDAAELLGYTESQKSLPALELFISKKKSVTTT